MRMFVTLAVEAMERTGAVAEHRPYVLFCLDEFAALDRVESIEKAAGQIAGFGVKLWPVIQDLTQLQRFSATTTSPGCKLAIILSWPPAGADPLRTRVPVAAAAGRPELSCKEFGAVGAGAPDAFSR